MPTDHSRYGGPAILAHWLIAALILTLLPLGLYMHGLPLSPGKLQLYAWHKWLGITVLVLAALRLAWRLAHRPPAPAWQLRIAELTHRLLYVLMLAVPLSGWLMSSAKGFPVVWFGVLPLPDLVSKDAELATLFQQMHFVFNYSLTALLGLHIAGALKHALIDRNATLSRMLPDFGRK
jgi:cytochrome b561